jgi:hypothetical protein
MIDRLVRWFLFAAMFHDQFRWIGVIADMIDGWV